MYLLGLPTRCRWARQVASVAQLAPRSVHLRRCEELGGERSSQSSKCAVSNPTTARRHLDESLTIVQALLAGDTVDFSGHIFQLEQATILPRRRRNRAHRDRRTIHAAFRRTTVRRRLARPVPVARAISEAVAKVEQLATDAGRDTVDWNHGLHLWCGVDPVRSARRVDGVPLPAALRTLRARYAPFGTPDEIAAYVGPYVDAGMRHLDLGPSPPRPTRPSTSRLRSRALLRAR